MQSTQLSLKELERCKKIGLKGIQIGSHVNDLNLDDSSFFPIFESALGPRKHSGGREFLRFLCGI